tara:strand:- start:2476 stop:3006 length:531 start_codon:yes stop_codon:yes gene_type:complete
MRKLENSELNRKTISEYKLAVKTPLIIILDDIRSMNNIGSIFRTADAFLIKKIFLCGISAKPPHKDIQKTALGSTDSVDWEYFKSTYELVKSLLKKGVKIIGIEQAEGSTSLEKFKPEKNKIHAFVFGNEVKGVSQEVLDLINQTIEIPQFGTKHSLNISISAGILIWDYYNKINY